MNLINQTAAKASHLEDLRSIQNIVFFLQFLFVALLFFNPSVLGVFKYRKARSITKYCCHLRLAPLSPID
jgi:hypothetical protein